MTFLPAILSVVPVKIRISGDGQTMGDIFYDKLSSFITRRYRSILVVGSVIAFGMISVVPRVEFNDQWIEYFDQRVTFRSDTDYAIQHLPAVYPMEFSVGSEGPNGINNPEYLSHLERFTEWLKAHPKVEHVYSYTDIIKRLNRNMHGDDDSYYRIPAEQELAAQYLFLYEISLPFGLDLNDRINVDKSATRVTATLDNASTVDTRAFIEDSENWLRSNTPEYMWTKPTSANVMFSYSSQRNIESCG
jgi:predicted RND superfamily exporter protein